MHLAQSRVVPAVAALGMAIALSAPSSAQTDLGPAVERTYGQGLPRDRELLLFDDAQYPTWPLTAGQERYADIDGARMKAHVVELARIALRYRDEGHRWWGRLPGTSADREGMAYMTRAFEELGLRVERFPFVLPRDWRPRDWAASYRTDEGATVELSTAFPVAGTKATGPRALTAEAVWVGVGSGADFIGRDVRGKAVVIYSVFVPGGRSHSASDRAGLFDANTRAVQLGAAMVINVMGVPGNGQFQPEGGVREVPHFTLSMDEGFALRDRLADGRRVDMSFRLEVDELTDVPTEYTIATLPGSSDEEIVVMSHTDGYFQAATDNAAGMASALELARFYAARPIAERPRTMRFIQFPDHHHGEVARGRPGTGIDATYPWEKVAVKLTMEHPSQTLLFMYDDTLTPTNAVGAFRWNALGSPAFEHMVFETLREFGVSVYAIENGPKNGNYAPSFHIIDHVIYHTSLDIPELVPASGLERSTRAFAAVLDRANAMTMRELRGEGFPPADGRGTLAGPESLGH
ncbi:MAG TPA: M28 family peptidase [Longimicrobiales bacterium]|nr:M28 family peptidase [Longimicrobiales bacterium]